MAFEFNLQSNILGDQPIQDDDTIISPDDDGQNGGGTDSPDAESFQFNLGTNLGATVDTASAADGTTTPVDDAGGSDPTTDMLTQYKNVAQKFDIQLPDNFEINPDTYEEDYYKLIAEGQLKKDNPLIYEVYKNGIDVNEYFESAMRYNEIQALSDHELYAENEATLEITERMSRKEFTSQEQVDEAFNALVAEKLEEAQGLKGELLKRIVTPLRQSLADEAKNLPAALAQQKAQAQANYVEQEVSAINENLESILKGIESVNVAKNVLPIQLSDAQHKEFVEHFKQNLTAKVVEGESVIPFFEKLSGDSKALSAMVQLHYLWEKGGLNAIKSQIRTSTLDNIAPVSIRTAGDNNNSAQKRDANGVIEYTVEELKQRAKK